MDRHGHARRVRQFPGMLLMILLAAGWPVRGEGAMHTFPAGSLVIPVDGCWQPAAEQPLATGCSGGGSLAAAAGAYGLAYRLQRAGVTVYQASAPAGTAPPGIPFVIDGAGAAPVVAEPGGLLLDPPSRMTADGRMSAHLIDYPGQPFLVDARELDSRAEAIMAGYPAVRRHRALVPFSAALAMTLNGLPTAITALDEGAAANLETALALAGLTGSGGLAVVPADPQADPDPGRAHSGCHADNPGEPLQGPCGLPALLADLAVVPSTGAPRESVTTASIVDESILYVASAEFPGAGGHLRAIALRGDSPRRLWDAAAGIAPPGTVPLATTTDVALLAPRFAAEAAGERLIFTNLGAAQGYRLLTFDASAATVLQPLLGAATPAAAAALINAVRGRVGTSPLEPGGAGDRPHLLGAIDRSSPALVGGSPYVEAAMHRDRVIYAGADDGLLHAVVAGRRREDAPGFDPEDAGCGRELWAYLPGSLLPALAGTDVNHPARLPIIAVDGAPTVEDLYIDSDGDGRCEWRTVLVGTASAESANQGLIFALDVTDPRTPRLLWERALPELGLGRSRGAALGWFGKWPQAEPRVFLTAGTAGRLDAAGNPAPFTGRFGVVACALKVKDGALLWRFAAPYEGAAGNLADPPTAPVLMMAAPAGGVDGMLFGDLAGRLWSLDPASGAPLNGGPVWQSPQATVEPVGGALTVRNRLVLFGTGGVAYAADQHTYSVYAVEILPAGARLLWRHPLDEGEKLWGAPLLDRFGRAYLGLGSSRADEGRLLVMTPEGEVAGALALAGAPQGGVAMAPGALVTVSRTGVVEQIGELGEESPAEEDPGRVRVWSWRKR